MQREDTSIKCCCCKIEITTFLSIWATLKVILDIVLILFCLYLLLLSTMFHPFQVDGFTGSIFGIVGIIVVDIILMGVLVNGICTKNISSLKAIYYYSFYLAVVTSLLVIGFIMFFVANLFNSRISVLDVIIILCIFGNVVNNTAMVREEPFFKKCCGFIPLKTCIQVWSGFKSAADVSVLVFLLYLVLILAQYHEFSNGPSLGHGLIVIIFILFIDCIFMLVLTVGLCTRNLRTLKIYFYYSLYMVFVSGFSFLTFAIFGFLHIWKLGYDVLYVVIVLCLIINFVLDVCIIFTLKSEMIKLRNKQQYGFVKMSSLIKDGEIPEPEPFQGDEENIEE